MSERAIQFGNGMFASSVASVAASSVFSRAVLSAPNKSLPEVNFSGVTSKTGFGSFESVSLNGPSAALLLVTTLTNKSSNGRKVPADGELQHVLLQLR